MTVAQGMFMKNMDIFLYAHRCGEEGCGTAAGIRRGGQGKKNLSCPI